jgi:Arc/MetJ-type ribon-helix-helix transcriptional regulator
MSKMMAVRVDESVIQAVEAVRDPELFPTQSDFVREAIRRLVRDERRRRLAAEIRQSMADPAEVELAEQIAEANTRDLATRLLLLEKGDS